MVLPPVFNFILPPLSCPHLHLSVSHAPSLLKLPLSALLPHAPISLSCLERQRRWGGGRGGGGGGSLLQRRAAGHRPRRRQPATARGGAEVAATEEACSGGTRRGVGRGGAEVEVAAAVVAPRLEAVLRLGVARGGQRPQPVAAVGQRRRRTVRQQQYCGGAERRPGSSGARDHGGARCRGYGGTRSSTRRPEEGRGRPGCGGAERSRDDVAVKRRCSSRGSGTFFLLSQTSFPRVQRFLGKHSLGFSSKP